MLCQLHRYFGKSIKCYLVSKKKKSVQQYRSLARLSKNKNSYAEEMGHIHSRAE